MLPADRINFEQTDQTNVFLNIANYTLAYIYLPRQPVYVGEDRDDATQSPRGGLVFNVVDRSLFHLSILRRIHTSNCGCLMLT